MQTFSEQSALGMNSMISSIVRVIGFPNAHAILLKTAELFMVNSGVYAIFSASFHFSLDGKKTPRWEATSHQGIFLIFQSGSLYLTTFGSIRLFSLHNSLRS